MPQAITTKGSNSSTMVLGGRFVQSVGTQNMPGTGPSETISYIGFDTFANRYELTMLSSVNNTTLRATGMPNQDGSAIVFYGPMDEPMLNFRGRTVRYTYRLIDDNTFAIEIDDLAIADPENERVVTLTCTRKKM